MDLSRHDLGSGTSYTHRASILHNPRARERTSPPSPADLQQIYQTHTKFLKVPRQCPPRLLYCAYHPAVSCTGIYDMVIPFAHEPVENAGSSHTLYFQLVQSTPRPTNLLPK